MSEESLGQGINSESIINQLRQEVDERIIQLVPQLIDDATVSRTTRAAADIDPTGDGLEKNAGVNILFLKNGEYIESEEDNSGNYIQFGTPSKVDGQGNYTMTIGCKIVDDDENSEYWEIDYSIVELS
jgi:hypothetical protein